MSRGLIFALCLVAGAAASASFANAQKEPDWQVCPDRLVAGVTELTCLCPAEAMAGGSVWGSDPYTDDSAICRSALHAGALGVNGGIVQVVETPGQGSYPASTRNSVASGQWGNWSRSIAFRSISTNDRRPSVAACPANAVGLSIGTRLTCACSAEAMASGPIWGSGPYTADSSLCRAAVHAGLADGAVDEIEIRVLPGLVSFPASRRNGVDSGAWGNYGLSFEVIG
jgi:hypothetical protein